MIYKERDIQHCVGVLETSHVNNEVEEFVSIDIDNYIKGNKSTIFAIECDTENMSNQGIFEGDTIVIDISQIPVKGSFVLTRYLGEYNASYFTEPIEYIGVIKYIVRNFNV